MAATSEKSKQLEVLVEKGSGTKDVGPPAPVYPLWARVGSAIMLAVIATFIVMVNKSILTVYRFPSFLLLALGQMMVTIFFLALAKCFRLVEFPSPSLEIFKQILPLSCLFFGNIVFSLGGTQNLSLPMYITLRKFSNIFIIFFEWYFLGVVATKLVRFTVSLMILGACIAVSDDLAFDLVGYVFIFATNLCSSTSGVLSKKTLNNKTLGKYGLMFHNCLLMAGPTLLLSIFTGDLRKGLAYPGWGDPWFVSQFFLGCVAGFFITYATLLCTQYNSYLTTSIVGVLKNCGIAYAGIFLHVGGDYVYSLTNFLGINVSLVGAVLYSYAAFRS